MVSHKKDLPQIEYSGINLQNEGSLHAALKDWYAKPGDRFEVKVADYIIDIVRDDQLLEIQTKNFSAMKKKLKFLLENNYEIQLIHPITVDKWIVKEDIDQNIISRRKSPKRGKLVDIFAELIRIPHLLREFLLHKKSFSLVLLFIDEEEIRRDDGKGSWRRKGVSIVDRKLLHVRDHYYFQAKADFLSLLPSHLNEPFSTKTLAKSIGCTVHDARKLSYTYKKMGLIVEVGKQGNQLLYQVIDHVD